MATDTLSFGTVLVQSGKYWGQGYVSVFSSSMRNAQYSQQYSEFLSPNASLCAQLESRNARTHTCPPNTHTHTQTQKILPGRMRGKTTC